MKYDEKVPEIILTLARLYGYTTAEIAAQLEISEHKLITEWGAIKECREALETAKTAALAYWIREMKDEKGKLRSLSPSVWSMVMKNSFGWTEKLEEKPVELDVSEMEERARQLINELGIDLGKKQSLRM